MVTAFALLALVGWAASRGSGRRCRPLTASSVIADLRTMLPFYEYLSIALMVTFILVLFSRLSGGLAAGRPVDCSLLRPLASRWASQFGFDTFLMTSWTKLGGVIDRFDAIMSNWVLVSLPMFVYMGLMLDRSGVADTMMRNFVKVFGGIRGGLGLTVVVIGILLAASTGIVGASVVLLAMLSMPIMLQHHYSKAIASGVVAASGTLGILIPPSIMLVLMADQVSVSVGDLFMGALIPGVLPGRALHGLPGRGRLRQARSGAAAPGRCGES
jgi:TRAP-type mannitol/chloroaromatic compound transport system permease large subunit